MKTLKDIKKFCKENKVPFRCDESNRVYIKACDIGDNFYDYGEEPKKIMVNKKYIELVKDSRVIILECCDCCGCAGW